MQIKYIRLAEDVRANNTIHTRQSHETRLIDPDMNAAIRSLTLQRQQNKKRGNGGRTRHIEAVGLTIVEEVVEEETVGEVVEEVRSLT